MATLPSGRLLYTSEKELPGHGSAKSPTRQVEVTRTNEDSSLKVPAALSAGVKASSFHLSRLSSLSQGLSFLCVDGILNVELK